MWWFIFNFLLLFSGVVFYAMVIGKLPFQSKKPNATTEENRKQLIFDVKQGLCSKHFNAMHSYSSRKF